MAQSSQLWTAWKALAHRAAVVQSNVLLTIMYVVAVTPLALVRRLAGWSKFHQHDSPEWSSRPDRAGDRLTSARRQF